MSNKEIERRFKITLNQKQEIIEALTKMGAEFIGENHQKDVYYEPNFKDYEINGETMEALRIRHENGNAVMCYKKIHRECDPIYCDEYESIVQDACQVEKMLFAFGFKVQILIDKKRKSFSYENFEFDFDSVEGLGEFLEVELKGDEADVGKIYDFVKPFGLSQNDATFDGIIKLMKNAGK